MQVNGRFITEPVSQLLANKAKLTTGTTVVDCIKKRKPPKYGRVVPHARKTEVPALIQAIKNRKPVLTPQSGQFHKINTFA